MDADWDGFPCETVWPRDDVVNVWGEPLPSPLVTGEEPTPSCVNGWTTPPPGSEPRRWVFDNLNGSGFLAADDHAVILELRYFIGPEDANVVAPRRDVERWYIEARSRVNPTTGVRCIGRRIDIGEGISATAPLGSTEFEPGTWRDSEAGGYDPFEPAPCLSEYGPFCECPWGVSGCSCEPEESDRLACFGPPPEVMGCLSGL